MTTTNPRIHPVQADNADPKTQAILDAVQKKMGRVPNLISTMAQSPAVANEYLGFSQALAGGALAPALREQIALVVGESNGCDYCVAAHSALGRNAGLGIDEVTDARRGVAANPQTAAALSFARRLVDNRGHVSDAEVQEVREAGFCDGDVAEIIANVALNIFTNYFNHVAGTEVDFPRVPELV